MIAPDNTILCVWFMLLAVYSFFNAYWIMHQQTQIHGNLYVRNVVEIT